MALSKAITLENGITVNYHRVVSINNITNQSSIIEVASYTSEEKRLEEKSKLLNNEPMKVYIRSKYYLKSYNKNLNVDSAYEYIKTLDEFTGAIDN